MRIRDEVCSQPLANKLKELGMKQSSLFYWIKGVDTKIGPKFWAITSVDHFEDGIKGSDCMHCSAYTSDELLNIIPAHVLLPENHPVHPAPFNSFFLTFSKRSTCNIQWIGNYHSDTMRPEDVPFGRKMIPHNIYDEKLSDFSAKLLIYLIENELVRLD